MKRATLAITHLGSQSSTSFLHVLNQTHARARVAMVTRAHGDFWIAHNVTMAKSASMCTVGLQR
eukprot:3575192-Pyramimonas_sp.AAC.1